MSDIVKGVLGGGWSLLVGWILPTALNLALLWFGVVQRFPSAPHPDAQDFGVGFLVAAVALGLVLAGLQTPLYRALEGYVGWRPDDITPLAALLNWSRRRHLRRKRLLRGRLDLLELSALDRAGALRDELRPRLAEVRADRTLKRYAASDARRGAAQVALLRERLRRYPVDDAQVVPTRLGNAIRRLEEYGYDRYRLDSQLLWYELVAVAPPQARKDAEDARTTVDFLVCLLYGHVIVAVCAWFAIGAGARPQWLLLLIAVALAAAALGWYRVATVATDEWAAAVRALVNVGRRRLALSLGLALPTTLAGERTMWTAVSRMSARPFDGRSAEVDEFRRPEPPWEIPEAFGGD